MNTRTERTSIHPFLYLFIMDAIQLYTNDYATYAKNEPDFAQAFFKAYIAAFQTPRDGRISQELLKKINACAMQHMPKVLSGSYRIRGTNFKLSREIYVFPNGTAENTTYSSTEAGLNEFIQYWFLQQNRFNHVLEFKKDDSSSPGLILRSGQNAIQAYKPSHGTYKTIIIKPNELPGIINKWFYSDYRCIISSMEGEEYISSMVQLILDDYHQEIQRVHIDDERIYIIAKYMQRIEQLHPFADGNVRTCAILINKLLSDFNLPLTILLNPNRLDCCDLAELVRSIKEGQIIFQRLMEHRDANQFRLPLSKPILDSIMHITVPAYDLKLPDLATSFFDWVIARPQAGFLTQYNQGFFVCPKAVASNALRESLTPALAALLPEQAQALTDNIFEREDYALLLRRAYALGAFDIIQIILSFQIILAIQIEDDAPLSLVCT